MVFAYLMASVWKNHLSLGIYRLPWSELTQKLVCGKTTDLLEFIDFHSLCLLKAIIVVFLSLHPN